MATLVLGAAGAAVGGSLGGSALGLGAATIGRAVGATVGRAIDQRLLGGGSAVVDHGRVDRFRLSGGAEGEAIPRLYGRMRVAGHVIWASPFRERVSTTGGGGKGGSRRPAVREHSYVVSLAVALCEGPVRHVGRAWADGRELARGEVAFRVHDGSEDQVPEALIEAEEGVGAAPAYRGTAYVVIEDLDLGPFGNRVPQFSFEVVRGVAVPGEVPAPQDLVRGVSLIPGTGEFALATRRVDYASGGGPANVHGAAEVPDLLASLSALRGQVPRLRAASLVVAWFGDDLRCGSCRLRPMVDQGEVDGVQMRWSVAGQDRAVAAVLPRRNGRPIYGGTPCDASVIEAIGALKAGGQDVTYHPFVLMTQLPGNGLPDPHRDGEQGALPWRGRITASVAPGRGGSPDGTAKAEAEVAAFFGHATAADFEVAPGRVGYRGAADWGYRRFVLHQAALCAAAGGVEAFCIGSELRGLTRVRGEGGRFPAVDALRALAGEVRRLLPAARIGYAADWTEYGAYAPDDGTGDVLFPLDPLWAAEDIDFVGIDFYAPLADWRDGSDHADAGWGSGHALGYLAANVEGGEGYDWYYASDGDRDAQRRLPIEDGAHGEPWVFRPKDLRGWWSNPHHERRGGVRSPTPTDWTARAKPIRLVEYGCGAVDKGANAPNRFPDPISSEAGLPPYSNGLRDDAMQMQYLRALLSYWGGEGRNPVSAVYGGGMLDLDHSCVWAWDARPWPAFPEDPAAWGDAPQHETGHWWSGRAALLPAASVVADVCRRAGVERFDVEGVRGVVRGLLLRDVQDGRADLQPLLSALGVEAAERTGVLVFRTRADRAPLNVDAGTLVRAGDTPVVTEIRAGVADGIGRTRLRHVGDGGAYDLTVAESVDPHVGTSAVSDNELPMVLTVEEGQALADRLLADAAVGRATATFSLAPSRRDLGPGTVVRLSDRDGLWRIDRIGDSAVRRVEAVRVDVTTPTPARRTVRPDPRRAPHRAAGLIRAVPMDLPSRDGAAPPNALHLAVSAHPWPDVVAVLSAPDGVPFSHETALTRAATIGTMMTPLPYAGAGVIDYGRAVVVDFGAAALSSVGMGALIGGANTVAIGDGAVGGWEVLQFGEAEPLGGGRWALSRRLRGRRGTEVEIRDPWPVGSVVVVLDGSETIVGGGADAHGVARRYRAGPARLGIDHETYVSFTAASGGIADAAYAPAHLSVVRAPDGDRFDWIARGREVGDRWGPELGLPRHRYVVRASVHGEAAWQGTTGETWHAFERDALARHGLSEGYVLAVARLSEAGMPGRWASIAVS